MITYPELIEKLKAMRKIAAKPNSAVASQPCSSDHITADKRLRFTSPKLPSATSFIRKSLYAKTLEINVKDERKKR